MKRTLAIALIGTCLVIGSALGMDPTSPRLRRDNHAIAQEERRRVDERAHKFALLAKTSPNYIQLNNCPKEWQGKQAQVKELLLSQSNAITESIFLNETYVEIDCEKMLTLLDIQPKKPRQKNYNKLLLPVATGAVCLCLGFLLAKK